MKEKLSIAIFTDSFLPKYDGVVMHIYNTSLELVRRGHRVIIVAPEPSFKYRFELRRKGIIIYPVAVISSFIYPEMYIALPARRKLKKFLIKKDVDILHFHTPLPVGLLALRLGRRLKKPVFATYHTLFTEIEYQKVARIHWIPLVTHFLWEYSIRIHNRCDAIIAPTEYTKRELIRHKIKVPVEVISNGIDLSLFNPERVDKKVVEELKRKYKLKKPTFLYIGRLSYEKNLDLLIRGFAKFLKRYPEGKLIIVGDGPIKKKMEKWTRDLGIEKSVIFFGRVENKQLPFTGVYNVSRAFLTLSTSETQNISAIEAMSMGLPLIVPRSRGVQELVKDNGFLVNPNDSDEFVEKLVDLTENDDLFRKFSKNSLLRSRRFDIGSTTEELIKFYMRYGSLTKGEESYQKG